MPNDRTTYLLEVIAAVIAGGALFYGLRESPIAVIVAASVSAISIAVLGMKSLKKEKEAARIASRRAIEKLRRTRDEQIQRAILLALAALLLRD